MSLLPPQPHLPPAIAEYENTLHSQVPGAAPTQNTWKMFRSSTGDMRVDSGTTSVITKPAAKQTILLDHVKQEARVLPMPPKPPAPPPLPQMPGAPKMPAAPAPPGPPSLINVKDLGKKVINGHEAVGKQYTFQPPKPPQMPPPPLPQPPPLPKVPTLPKVPGMPQAAQLGQPPQPPKPPGIAPPTLPQPPKPPALPMASLPKPPAPPTPPAKPKVVKMWHSPKLQLPVLTETSGGPGLQKSVLKSAAAVEPPKSAFQVPPGYKLVHTPKLPHMPKLV